MSDYLKQKAPSAKDVVEYLKKEQSFNRDLKKLKDAPIDMVKDFQNPVTVDLPVEKINTIGEVIPLKTGAEFAGDQAVRNARKSAIESVGDTLNYKDLREEFTKKAKLASKIGGKKLLGAVPVLGTLAALSSGDASAAAEQATSDALDLAPTLATKLGAASLSGPIGLSMLAADAVAPSKTGPSFGSMDQRITDGSLTEEDKQQLSLEQARIKALQNIGR